MEENSQQVARPLEPKKASNKVFFSAVVIICILVIILLIAVTNGKKGSSQSSLQNNPSSNTQENSVAEDQRPRPLPQINTVQLTDNGFSPAKISIHKGTAVKWINSSNTDNASVNSDDYPMNQRFPELNLGKFNRGSSVAHIFEAVGTYTYHNQFNPKQTGVIVVK